MDGQPASAKDKERIRKAAFYLANKELVRSRNEAWRKANPDKWNAQGHAWRLAHPEKAAEHFAKYRMANRAILNAKRAAYRAANLEKARQSVRHWQKANPAKQAERAAKRRALIIQRTPSWARETDFLPIYICCAQLSQLLGFKWHVDHIIPLNGKLVSGLHILENLQCLSAYENCRKHNIFEPGELL